MQSLPIEIWKLVVEALHRPIPAAGESANWNDHLHQGDLVSVQRVNKVCRCVSREANSHYDAEDTDHVFPRRPDLVS